MPSRTTLEAIGLLILRIGFGGFMMTHGWSKLQMLLNGQADRFGDPIGLGPGLSLVLITFAEFFCALAIVLGLATRLAGIPLVIGMAVAAFLVHGPDPWTMGTAAKLYMAGEAQSWGSKEPAMIYLAGFLGLMFTGAGRFSIDALILRLRNDRQASRKSELLK